MAQIVQQLARQNELLEQRLTQQASEIDQRVAAQGQAMELRMNQQMTAQQQLMQQTLEMQRAQTEAQLSALKDLGTVQVAKAAQETRDHHTKAFTKVKPFKGDVNAWADWRYKFRVEASKAFKDAKAILDWAEEQYDKPISSADVATEASRRGFNEMLSLNMQLHGDLVSLMEDGTEGFEIVRNSHEEVGLDAWRRLNHRFDPMNPLRNLQLLEQLIQPPQAKFEDVVAGIEKWEQKMRITRTRLGDDIETLWKNIHMVCIQKICPKTLKDHLAVQAASIDSPDKQKVAIEKFLQANVHVNGASPMDLDALAKGKGGGKGGKPGGKTDKGDKFEGECNWCKKKGHKEAECWQKAAGKPRTPEKQAGNADGGDKGGGKGDGKGAKGDPKKQRKGAVSLERWPGGESVVSTNSAGGLFVGAVDQASRYSDADWQAWNAILEHAGLAWKAYKAGERDLSTVSRGERLDLTIDSGAAVCGLPKDMAKSVQLESLPGKGQEYTAANGATIEEVGTKTPTLTFQNGDVEKLKFRVMDVHKPLVAVSKIVAAGNKVVFQLEGSGGSYIESLATGKRKKVYEKNGVYVLPSWVVESKAGGTLAPVDVFPNGGQVNL